MLSPRSRIPRPTSSPSSASRGSSLAAAGASTNTSSRNVLIHVFDEYRKSAKDFVCRRDVLLTNMKYFQKYLNQSNEHDEIDISVHCDVEVFAWLVAYMQQQQQQQVSLIESTSDTNRAECKRSSSSTLSSSSPPSSPRLSLDNIASILVSSEFLQMETLVNECVRFITTRMQAFLQLRVDLGCLSDTTIAKIAERCSAEQLQALHDPKDKILSKLHKKKLEALVRRLREPENRVERCINCGNVYLKTSQAVLTCPLGPRQIGVHGELVARHEARSGWRLDDFLRELMGGTDKNASATNAPDAVSWNAAYWYLWASTNCFSCSTCKRYFAFLELHGCVFHSGFVAGFGSDAKFSCCGARAFDVDDLGAAHIRGCSMKKHTPDFTDSKDLGADANGDVGAEDSSPEKHFETVCKLPGLWDLIRSCENVVRPAVAATAAEAARTGKVPAPAVSRTGATSQQTSLLHSLLHGELTAATSNSHLQLQASQSSAKRSAAATSSSSSGTTGSGLTSSGGDTISPQRQRQYRALQLQEKDRLRHQLLARRLVQMRKNLTA